MKDIKIPFDKNGAQQYANQWSEGFHWKDNYEFHDTLVIDAYYRGCSAAGLHLIGSDEQGYYMFMKDTMMLIADAVINHGSVTGSWTFAKRGMSYGIQFIG